ncbi:MAG: DUF4191 domain-containing protein [Actinomycetota bacterium]
MPRKSTPDETAPKKKRFAWFRQITMVFRQTRQLDPRVVWWMLLAFVVTMVVFIGIGFLIGHPIYLGLLGVPTAVMVAAIVMARRAERAAYRQLEGQPGGSGAVLQALRRGWYYDQEPVAVEATRPGDFTGAALVFRAISRSGVVLIVEGPRGRADKLGEKERKKITRLLPNVPVTVLRAGSGDGDVPVRKIPSKMRRMRPALSKAEAAAVHKRLTALGGMKPPVPQGIDPTRARPDRKGMRGR